MPLVFNSLGGGYTDTHIPTSASSNFKKPGARQARAWFKTIERLNIRSQAGPFTKVSNKRYGRIALLSGNESCSRS